MDFWPSNRVVVVVEFGDVAMDAAVCEVSAIAVLMCLNQDKGQQPTTWFMCRMVWSVVQSKIETRDSIHLNTCS